MARTRLRVYYGPDDDTTTATVTESERSTPNVTIPLGDVFSVLADAVQHRRDWLKDFQDDEITISTDLYEVILAYQHFRRPSA